MDFKELSNDSKIKEKIMNVHSSVNKIKQLVETAQKKFDYDKMETFDQINYDIFMCYTLNTLYWIYLRTKGLDPNENDVKKELLRIQEYMVKAKKVKDRLTLRPKLDRSATKRFISHSLTGDINGLKNKKIKFN